MNTYKIPFCTLYIIRHGQSESNQAEVLGQKNSRLTEKGKEQARKRAEEFKHILFHAIYASDFVRAKETAEIIAKEQHVPLIQIAEALRERSWGKLENAEIEEERKELKRLRTEFEKLTKEERLKVRLTDGMETDEEALTRFTNFIKIIAKKHAGKTVLLSGHANILKILLVHIGFGTWQELPSGSVENTGYVKLLTDGEKFIIQETRGVNKQQI